MARTAASTSGCGFRRPRHPQPSQHRHRHKAQHGKDQERAQKVGLQQVATLPAQFRPGDGCHHATGQNQRNRLRTEPVIGNLGSGEAIELCESLIAADQQRAEGEQPERFQPYPRGGHQAADDAEQRATDREAFETESRFLRQAHGGNEILLDRFDRTGNDGSVVTEQQTAQCGDDRERDEKACMRSAGSLGRRLRHALSP